MNNHQCKTFKVWRLCKRAFFLILHHGRNNRNTKNTIIFYFLRLSYLLWWIHSVLFLFKLMKNPGIIDSRSQLINDKQLLYALVFALHRYVCSHFLLANIIMTKDPYSGWPVKIKVLCLSLKLIFTRALDRWYLCSLKTADFSACFLSLLYLYQNFQKLIYYIIYTWKNRVNKKLVDLFLYYFI